MAQVVRSPYSVVNIPANVSLSRFVLDKAAVYGTKTALVDPATGRSVTYDDLVTSVRRLANGLLQEGLRKGDMVCIYAPNMVEYFVIFHGIMAAGGTVVTSNPLAPPEELSRQLTQTRSTFLFTIPALLANVQATLLQGNISLKAIFTVGETVGFKSYTSLLINQSESWPDVVIDGRNDLSIISYSSGTSGMPKGVAHTHYTYVAMMCQMTHKDMKNMTPNEVVLAQLPFYHAFAIICVLNVPLIFGAKIIVMGRFNFGEYLQAMEDFKVTTIHIVPPIAVLLTRNEAASRKPMSTVRTVQCGGAPLGLEATFKTMFPHVCLRQVFGMTEVGLAIIRAPSGLPEGSVGVPVAGTEVKVVGKDGHLCEAGETGEMFLKGPQVMVGYLNQAQATAQAFDQGWFRTGDVVYYDNGGHIFVVDRCKELIKYKGAQVTPAELEAVLLQHDGIADAAVIGVPDEVAGEIPKAFVVVKPGHTLNEQQVMNFVAGHVAPQKKVRLVEFTSSVPKSPSGKILRRLLRDKHKNLAKL